MRLVYPLLSFATRCIPVLSKLALFLELCIPEIMPSKRNLSEFNEKGFAELDNSLQRMLNEPYLNGIYDPSVAKFQVGEPALSMSHGLWYDCFVKSFTTEKSLPTTMDETYLVDDSVKPVEVRMCEIRFDGWAEMHNQMVPENELVSRDLQRGRYGDAMGMLVAHTWNEWKRKQLGKSQVGMGKGAFFMTKEDFGLVEKVWQQKSGVTASFDDFIRLIHSGPNAQDSESVAESDEGSPAKRMKSQLI